MVLDERTKGGDDIGVCHFGSVLSSVSGPRDSDRKSPRLPTTAATVRPADDYSPWHVTFQEDGNGQGEDHFIPVKIGSLAINTSSVA